MTPLKIPDLIREAVVDPEMRALAITYWRGIVPTLLERRERVKAGGVRMSDAGRCVRELWAELRGELDLPLDPDVQLARFDPGILMGAWLACLFKAAMLKYAPTMRVELEPEVSYRGVPGHLDVFVSSADGDPYWVIDFKLTFWHNELEPPHLAHKYQVKQIGGYGASTGAPLLSLVTFGPAVYPRYDKLVQHDYYTDDQIDDVDDEIDRLRLAEADEAPVGDAQEAFRCKGCRYSNCDRNKNPYKTLVLEEKAS